MGLSGYIFDGNGLSGYIFAGRADTYSRHTSTSQDSGNKLEPTVVPTDHVLVDMLRLRYGRTPGDGDFDMEFIQAASR